MSDDRAGPRRGRGRDIQRAVPEGLEEDDLERMNEDGWPYDDEDDLDYEQWHGRGDIVRRSDRRRR